MLKKIFYFILVVVSAAYFGCSGNGNKPSSVSEENYKYSFSDTSNISFIEGKMKLLVNGESLTGEYTIDTSFSESPSGLSSLQGILSGNIEDKGKRIFLNMNPKHADNNIFVYADIVPDSIKGYWVNSSIVGIKAKGNFIAVKTQKK